MMRRQGRKLRYSNRHGAGFILLFLLGLRPAAVSAYAPAVRDFLIVDNSTDPLAFGDGRGGIFYVRYGQISVSIASVAFGFVDPVAVAPAPNGNLFVVDANADPLRLGEPYGALFEVNPRDPIPGQVRLIAASTLLRNPIDLLVEPEGTVLLLDADADPHHWGLINGALFRIDPANNNIDVVAAPAEFLHPRSLAWDIDGSVLILDQAANPLQLPGGSGALFRLSRQSGAISLVAALPRPQFVSPVAVTVIPEGAYRGDFLIVDKDADPLSRGTYPGAVFRLPRSGGPPVLITSDEQFVDPLDITLGTRSDFLVLDASARPIALPGIQGAVFRFDLATGAYLDRWASGTFKSLSGITELTGAEVDSSNVSWTDEAQGVIHPGSLITVRALLRNTGTDAAPVVTVADTLFDPWSFIVGSDSASAGQVKYNPSRRSVTWAGSLGIRDTVLVRFRARLSSSVPVGQEQVQRLYVRVDQAPTIFQTRVKAVGEFSSGTELFSDYGTIDGQNVGRVFQVEPDSVLPGVVWNAPPLKRPSDLVFLDDGRLVILDRSNPIDSLGVLFVYSAAKDQLRIIMGMRRSLGLADPQGIGLDRDGSLLLIDKDANPNQYPAPHDEPGAVFRVNLATGTLGAWRSDSSWVNPVDAVTDRNGDLLVIDNGEHRIFHPEKPPSVWVWPPGASESSRLDLPPVFFKAPSGLAVDRNNDIYVADPLSPAGYLQSRGAVLKIVHAGPNPTFSVATADSALRSPADCAVALDGTVLITDLDANPLHLLQDDPGAVFRLDPLRFKLSTAAADYLLRRPDGPATLGFIDLSRSGLSVSVLGGGSPMPTDTVRVDLALFNRGTRAATDGLATFRLYPSLTLVDASSEIGRWQLDRPGNQAAWSGRIAPGDTLHLIVRGRVSEDAAFGDPAGGSAIVEGGGPSLSLSASVPVRAPFPPSDLVVVDEAAGPFPPGGWPGAVFRFSTAGGRASLAVGDGALRQPSAMDWTPAGDLMVATLEGDQPGRLYRIQTSDGQTIPVGAEDVRMKSPVDLVWTPGGDLLLIDQDSDVSGPTGRGAIFKKDRGTGPLTLFSADSLYRGPCQAAFDSRGRLFLADRRANPLGLQGNTGAIFELDPGTGVVLSSFQVPDLEEPTGIAAYTDTSLLVTDMAARPQGTLTGALFEYFPDSRRLRTFLASSAMSQPRRTLVMPSRRLLIADRAAVRPGQQTGIGTIFEYDPVGPRLRYVAWSDSFSALDDLVQKVGPVVTFQTYASEDLNGPPLHPADRLRIRGVLRNTGVLLARNMSYADTVPAEVSLLESTVTASSGEIQAAGGHISWTGYVTPGDSVQITYDVQLNPAMAAGKRLHFRAWAQVPALGTLSRSLSLQTLVPLEPGYLYVADGSATPYGPEEGGGAIFKVDIISGFIQPMLTSPLFRRPKDLALFGGTHPQLLILDEFSLQGEGRGTLFLFDPATLDVSVVGTHASWTSLSKVVAVSETEALVLDSRADPFGLTPGPGPGAVYRVDIPNRIVTPIFSDTTLVYPTSMDLTPFGDLLICDQDADPAHLGREPGAVFKLNLNTLAMTPFSLSTQWVNPTSIVARPDGGAYLIDRDATPILVGDAHGSIFTINREGAANFLAVSPFFRRLCGLTLLGRNPSISDWAANPYGLGGSTGALFSWSPKTFGKFLPLSSSSVFATPCGMSVYLDATPAGTLTASAETRTEGIYLRWQGPPEEQAVRFLVYRRVGTGPDDPGDTAPRGYDLASGDRLFEGPGPHEFLDVSVDPGGWYVYLIARVENNGGDVSYSAPIVAQAATFRLELLPVAPNPFRPATRLRFTLPPPGGETGVQIFDVQGRVVRTLHRGPLAPGPHDLAWDGKDDRGWPLASGLYFSRLEFRGEARTGRLVLLR